MSNYKLKKEAIPFFAERHATKIYPLSTWESMEIDINALQEVKSPHIILGHSHKSGNSASLGGWCAEKGSEFHFTIQFPSVSFMEHDKFSKERITRDLMDKIQSRIDDFFINFIENEQK